MKAINLAILCLGRNLQNFCKKSTSSVETRERGRLAQDIVPGGFYGFMETGTKIKHLFEKSGEGGRDFHIVGEKGGGRGRKNPCNLPGLCVYSNYKGGDLWHWMSPSGDRVPFPP